MFKITTEFNSIDILFSFLFLILVFLYGWNFFKIINIAKKPKLQPLNTQFIDDLRVCFEKFSIADDKNLYCKIKLIFDSDIGKIEKYNKAIDLVEQTKEENPKIVKVRKVVFICNMDPAKFVLLSLLNFEYPFLVCISECGKKYIYYYNYEYSKPVFHLVEKSDSVFSFISNKLKTQHFITKQIKEIDIYQDKTSISNKLISFNRLLLDIHVKYLDKNRTYTKLIEDFENQYTNF